MSRPPPVNRRDRFVQELERFAENEGNGYSQKPPSGRWGPDFDCSSLIYQAAANAGYPVGTGSDKVRFTGTMLKDFKDAGFQILPFANVGISDLKIGDILLNLALHAEVYVGEGESIGATGAENGGYVGESGDQTGHEIEKHPVTIFDRGWDYVLRPPETDEDEEQEEGEDEMPMSYGPNVTTPNQPWQNSGNSMYPSQGYGNRGGYPQGGPANQMTGYPMNMPNTTGFPMGNQNGGYPQGNLGQMNGYAQAGNQYPHSGGMQGYSQGNMPMGPQGVDSDLCFVMGIEGAKNTKGHPNTRKAVFDEDKPLMYIVSFDQQGNVNDIHVYSFEECSEEMPQHLSPLMRHPNNTGDMMGMQNTQYITRDEVMQMMKEMMGNVSNKSANESNGQSRNGNASNGQSRNGNRSN